MKDPIIVMIPDMDVEEQAEFLKLLSETTGGNILRGRQFIVVDSNLSKLFSSEEDLLNLANRIKVIKSQP